MRQITEEKKGMSLEDLLAKEGFRERKPNLLIRAFSQSQPTSMPLYPYRDQRKSKILSNIKKTDRRKSDTPRSGRSEKFPPSNKTKPKGIIFKKETIDEEGSEEKSERVAKYLEDAQHTTAEPEDFLDDDKFDSSGTYKDIYSNEIYSHQTSETEMEKGTELDERRKMENLGKSYYRSRTLAQGQNIQENHNKKYVETEQNSPEPAMDEAAIRAVVSILNGYIKRFLKNGDVRTSFRHNCFASLKFSELEEDLITESKVLANLEQAIEVIERAAEERSSERELKKASLQLSVITGLDSNELKDGFTSGIPNSKLSACAHLYLSIIHKLQKKDRVAAQHVLQVFCDSPFQARKILLPDLWEHMFFPHLEHLREWYVQEVEFLGDNTPSKERKIKLLEKVYNEIIDSGTFQFAVYYKDWLSDGIDAPSIPSINVPSLPFRGVEKISSKFSGKTIYEKGSSSDSLDVCYPVGSLSPQPMVSKKLYDTMFGRLRKTENKDVEISKKSDDFFNIQTRSGRSLFEEKQELPCSSTAATHLEQIDQKDDASHLEEELLAKDVWTLHRAGAPVYGHIGEIVRKSPPSILETEANEQYEVTLKRRGKSVFTEARKDETLNFVLTSSPPYPNSHENSRRLKSISEESQVNNSIPADFICPLTGLLFEDPVTLETGHSFEREAIREWLEQGKRKCPVSGKKLESQYVPHTNLILKRIIESWKSENICKNQKEEVILVIHQLLTAFSQGRLNVSAARSCTF